MCGSCVGFVDDCPPVTAGPLEEIAVLLTSATGVNETTLIPFVVDEITPKIAKTIFLIVCELYERDFKHCCVA